MGDDLTYSIRTGDGQQYGPAPMATLVQWAREGRVPHSAMVVPAFGLDPYPVMQEPAIAAVLSAPPTVGGAISRPADGTDAISVVIPYRNALALTAYYIAIFSLIPVFGLVLGPLAFGLGIGGLRYAARVPAARGRVHAWIGVVLGGLTGLGHIVVILLMIVYRR